jgi:D-serine dehydratase
VHDGELYDYMRLLLDTEGIFIEPSSCAAFAAPEALFSTEEGRAYLEKYGLTEKLPCSTHILWATGGRLVPDEIWAKYMDTHIEY